MTGNHWSYDILKQLAIEGCTDIDQLKTLFTEEIGSKRRYDCITCVEDLIDCLERADELAEDNVELLHRMSNNQPKLIEALNAYTPPAVREPVNVYQELRLAEELRDQLRIGAPQVARATGQATASTAAPPLPHRCRRPRLRSRIASGQPYSRRFPKNSDASGAVWVGRRALVRGRWTTSRNVIRTT